MKSATLFVFVCVALGVAMGAATGNDVKTGVLECLVNTIKEAIECFKKSKYYDKTHLLHFLTWSVSVAQT